MRELGLMLDNLGASVIAPAAPPPQTPEPSTVEFRDVMFSYGDDGCDRFRLGPLNWTFHPGELTFVIGGNGSGKSSFVKLLTGLYTPDSGEIRLNGKPVCGAVAEDYQQLFSVVYSDYFLFDRVLGVPAVDLERRARRYLAALDLSDKIKFEGNSFSTTNVSQGQRRRLALLAAYLEDRPIYVLDEWAADQDPAFRQVFYHQILPELKSRGKTVVVVTHDDRYFEIGDRIIKLEYGKMVETLHCPGPASVGGAR
jgi:putative ATP-binding cassette transporter